jgi:hypothetical protein
MDTKPLETTTEVIEALGGTSAVAELTGSTYAAAFNWRGFERFPAKTFIVMSDALAAKGKSASPSLWGMIAAPERAAS